MKLHRIANTFVLILILSFAAGCSGSTQRMTVGGQSMVPALANGAKVVVDKKAYESAPPQRTDIIAFADGTATMIKRVIGLPGEKVEIKDKKVYIDGKELDEGYLNEQNSTEAPADSVWQVPDKSVFVLGDNRMESKDSRVIGFVSYDKIMGKVLK